MIWGKSSNCPHSPGPWNWHSWLEFSQHSFIYLLNTCVFPTVTCQNVFWEKGLHIALCIVRGFLNSLNIKMKIRSSHPRLHHHRMGRIQPQRCWADRPGRRRCSPKERFGVRTRTEPYFLHKHNRMHKYGDTNSAHKHTELLQALLFILEITITRHSGW